MNGTCRFYGQHATLCRTHGFDGIHHEIQGHLLQLDLIADNGRKMFTEVDLTFNAALPQVHINQSQNGPTANNPTAEVTIAIAENGGVSRRVKQGKNGIFFMRNVCCIGQYQSEIYCASLRERRHALQHVFKQQVVQPGEGHSAFERLKRDTHFSHPILFDGGVTDDDSHIGRLREHLQDVLHGSGMIDRGRDPCFIAGNI